jgi:DNA polymerase/3'-5' exonuclease PolX
MSNIKIIKEFDKLIIFMKLYEYNSPNYIFRLKNIKLALDVIRNYKSKITLNNLDEFSKLDHIGKGTIERIKEILTLGYLNEIKDFNPNKVKNKNNLDKIIGIGASKIKELAKLGITTIDLLLKKIAQNEIIVSNTIKMGLKYYNIYQENIPRNEIDNIKKLIKKILDDKYFFEICGSYRRGKNSSNDIDILISSHSKNTKQLKSIIELLSSKLTYNNNQPFIVDNLITNITTKYMGFCKYKDNPIRRIDIRFVNNNNFYSALLYFTGSAIFNRNIRNVAKKLGYKLSEYGLKNINTGITEKISSEQDIFTILKLEYVKPQDR